jgi:uncharacterized protein YndB with AHSA1/START domain
MSNSSSNPSPELVINRTFRAPRELVWQAWADPKLMIKWMGPKHHPANHYENDFRPGGAWRSCLASPDGSEVLWLGGKYHELVEPERLVFTFAWDNHPDGSKNEMLVTLTLAEEGTNTRMTLRQTRFTSVEQRDDHGQGWSSSIDRLEELLVSSRAEP